MTGQLATCAETETRAAGLRKGKGGREGGYEKRGKLKSKILPFQTKTCKNWEEKGPHPGKKRKPEVGVGGRATDEQILPTLPIFFQATNTKKHNTITNNNKPLKLCYQRSCFQGLVLFFEGLSQGGGGEKSYIPCMQEGGSEGRKKGEKLSSRHAGT